LIYTENLIQNKKIQNKQVSYMYTMRWLQLHTDLNFHCHFIKIFPNSKFIINDYYCLLTFESVTSVLETLALLQLGWGY